MKEDTMTDKTLLHVDKLSVHFRQDESVVEAVKDVSFKIHHGEILALVGESGSGKSVTAHSVLQLLPKGSASHPNGRIVFDDTDLLQCNDQQIRGIRGNRISMIFQEPMTALNPLHTVEKQIGESLLLHKGLSGEAARERILELLELVGLPDPSYRLKSYPHELSGGQRQRVMIAMALANEPELLIADEPTTALDVTLQEQILALIVDLQKRLSMSVLLITHDLNVVKRFAQRVVVMQDGGVVEDNDCEALFSEPKHPYTKMLIESEPSGQAHEIADDASNLLSIENLRVWFPIKKGVFARTVDHIKAVDDISFTVPSGSTLGIVGESGSGKSTLVQALLRLQSSTGRILFEDTEIHDYSRKQMRPLRSEMQIVFQDPFSSLSPRMLISDILSEGLRVHGHYQDDPEGLDQVIEQALIDVELDPDVKYRYPHEFSGGQRQRIAIARAIVLNPKLVILDEPTSALDRSVQKQVLNLLRDLQEKHQLTYLFISHDLKVVRAMAHHLVVMRAGKIVESGDTEQVYESPQSEYTKQLISAAYA